MKTQNMLAALIAVMIAVSPVIAHELDDHTDSIDFTDTDVTDAEIEIVNDTFADVGLEADHPFYGFKKFAEGLHMLFTFDKAEKARLHVEFARRRLAEAKDLIERNKTERLNDIIADHQRELDESEDDLSEAKGIGKNVSIIARETEDSIDKSALILELVYEKVPDQAKPAIERAINNSLLKKARIRGITENLSNDEIEDDLQNETENHARRAISLITRLHIRANITLTEIDQRIQEALDNNRTIEKLEVLKIKIQNEIQRNLARINKIEDRLEHILEKRLSILEQRILDAQKSDRDVNKLSNIRDRVSDRFDDIKTKIRERAHVESGIAATE